MVSGDALLAEVLEAHGGYARWRASSELELQSSAGGFALASKLQRTGLHKRRTRVATDQQRVVFSAYPRAGYRGVFERGAVRIETDDGSVISERPRPRDDLAGPRRLLYWDHLDALYFGASSVWTYLAMPFIFAEPGYDPSPLGEWVERGQVWRRLAVSFPPHIHTHSREQVVYVGDDGLIRRHDYTAEEFGGWAKSAHYWLDHHAFDGLIIPRKRRVFPRRSDGRSRGHPLYVWIDIDDVAPAGNDRRPESTRRR